MSSALYGLTGRQNFAAVAQFGESADMGYLESYVTKRMRRPKSEVPGSIPGRRVMPGDTSAGDTVFDGEEKSEEQKTELEELREKVEDLQQQVFDQGNTETETYIDFLETENGTRLKVTTETVRWFPMEYVKKAKDNAE